MRKSPLRGGLYHLSLLSIVASSFNWGFDKLTGINIIRRVFEGFNIPEQGISLAICIFAIVVLWNNWVD